MPLFLSTYANKVDKKGRISVPAPFRATLADQSFQGVVLFKATGHACLEGFDFGTMAELSERLDHFDLFSNQQDDLATAISVRQFNARLTVRGALVFRKLCWILRELQMRQLL